MNHSLLEVVLRGLLLLLLPYLYLDFTFTIGLVLCLESPLWFPKMWSCILTHRRLFLTNNDPWTYDFPIIRSLPTRMLHLDEDDSGWISVSGKSTAGQTPF